MLENYLIIHKSILPDYYEKVLEVRRLLESGRVKDVSQAARQVGISRSTYYKYGGRAAGGACHDAGP